MLIFLHNYIPNPIVFILGPVNVYWYGLLLAVALLIGYWLVGKLAKKRQLPVGIIESLYINLAVWGFIGARLYHVLGERRFYLDNPWQIFAFWQGGLAIHGALLAGLLVILYFAKKRQLNFWELGDVLAAPLILGQAIGRWGNYFNQELFGKPTNLPWGIPIDIANRPAGFEQFSFFHPTFLYESLWDLAVFAFLLRLFLKNRKKSGSIFWLYFVLYPLGRLGVEFLRVNATPLIFGARLPLLVSAILVVVGAAMSWRSFRRA